MSGVMSDYFLQLNEDSKQRYLFKINAIGGVDPYMLDINCLSTNLEDFPNVLYPDIVNYLVHTKSAYTNEEMCAYKGMEAYNQAVCGWVKKLGVKVFDDSCLIIGKVLHSQRLNDKFLNPWIICNKNGSIQSAHCDCVAGLGEVCTHVCAVLFNIDEVVRSKEMTTRTGTKAYWMPPTSKRVDPQPISNLDLRTPKRRMFDEETLVSKEKKLKAVIPKVSLEEKKQFLKDIQESTSRGSVLHLITSPFAEQIKDERLAKNKFKIMSLFKPQYQDKALEELQNIGLTIDLSLTIEECKAIERETTEQSKCRSWYAYRAGRITASTFKRCCRTSLENPSLSLIKSICYPGTYRMRVRSLDYGCHHEKKALKRFINEMSKNHENFEVESSGLFINPNFPYFGASPDGIAECRCCGMALVEIKCPYCARNTTISDIMELKKFYLVAKDGKIELKKDHTYFYQIQMQLALTKADFCYLVVWSPKELVWLKVNRDENFWKGESEKAKQFFHKIILPEALGKFFTKMDSASSSNTILDKNEEEWDLDNEWEEIFKEWENVELYEEEVLASTSEPQQDFNSSEFQGDNSPSTSGLS